MSLASCKSDEGSYQEKTSSPKAKEKIELASAQSSTTTSSEPGLVPKITTDKKVNSSPKATKQEETNKAVNHTITAEKPILNSVLAFDRANHKWPDTITSGDIIDHAFSFKNDGKVDLIINSVDATCGCTRPSYPFIPIAPGEKGAIKMQYNSLGKTGWQRATLTVNSNEVAKVKRVFLDVYVKPKPKKKKGKKDAKKMEKRPTDTSKSAKPDSVKG